MALSDPLTEAAPSPPAAAPVCAEPIAEQRVCFPTGADFRRVLQQRVDAWFLERSRRGDPRLLFKGILICIWFLVSYVSLLVAPVLWLSMAAWFSLGLAAAALGFNVFHDANHGCFVDGRKGNALISMITCTLLGVSRNLWHYKHNAQHHVYTNVEGLDDDLQSRGFLRFSPWQPWRRKYAWQHLYFLPMYALSTIEWFFFKDFIQYFRGKMTNIQLPSFTIQKHIEFWTCKFIYVSIFLVLPFCLSPPLWVIGGFFIFHASFGLLLSSIFQLAHLNQLVLFHQELRGTSPSDMPMDWATNVMFTTADFGHSNPFLRWFSGGLNYQIEHHLFPRISHTFYPELAGLVRATAMEFGLPYHYKQGWFEMMGSHFKFLHALSRPTEPHAADSSCT